MQTGTVIEGHASRHAMLPVFPAQFCLLLWAHGAYMHTLQTPNPICSHFRQFRVTLTTTSKLRYRRDTACVHTLKLWRRFESGGGG